MDGQNGIYIRTWKTDKNEISIAGKLEKTHLRPQYTKREYARSKNRSANL